MYRYNQHSFVGGQLDRGLMGRQDLERYFQGASKLENFIVRKQGNITKRRGSEMIADMGDLFGTGDAIAYSRLIPLARDISAGYYILFAESASGERGCFLISDNGIQCNVKTARTLLDADGNPTGATEESESIRFSKAARYSDEYTQEDEGEYGEVQRWKVAEEATPNAIEIPYAGSEFSEIGFNQSGDTVFLVHRNHPPAKIVYDGTSVSYSTLDFASRRWARPQITKVEPKGFKGTGSSRNIDYVCTYVKNGIESIPSEPFSATYALPWNQEAMMEITCAKGNNETEPDYYNIYKKVYSDYGMIATVGASIVVDKKPVSYVGTALHTNTWRGPTGLTGSKIRNLSDYYLFHDKLFNGQLGSSNVPYVDIIGGASASALKIDFGDNSSTKISTFELQLDAFTCSITGGRAGRGSITYKITYNRHGNATFLKATATFTTANNTTIEIEKNVRVALAEYSPVTLEAGGARGGSYVNNPQIEHLNRSAIFDFSEDIKNNSTLSSDQTWQIKSIAVTFYDNETDKNIVTGYFHGMKFTNSFSNKNTLQDDYITPDLSLTPPQDGGHFEKTGDYPSCVTMYTQRLAFAATRNQPFTWWMSCVGDLYNFNTHASIRQDDAMEVTVPATEFPNINHMVLLRDLVLFCDNGEWIVRPLSGNTLAYDTVECKKQSAIGCSKSTPPIQVGDEIIFTDNSRRVIRSIKYQFTSDGYESSDLSILSQSLFFSNPVISMCYKQHPESLILCELSDGTVAALVYMKEHNVVAWTHHTLGGGWKCRGIASNKAHADETTHVAMLVEHPDGGTEIWRIRDDDESADFSAQLCMDGLRFALGSEIGEAAFTGGQAVYDLTTGEPVESAADLKPDGEYAVGYPFTSTFVSVRPEPQGNETFQWELKNAKLAHIRTLNGSSFTVKDAGLSDGYASPVNIDRSVTDGEITVPGLVDATDILLNGENSRDGRIEIRHDGILPLTIESFSVDYETQPLYGSEG